MRLTEHKASRPTISMKCVRKLLSWAHSNGVRIKGFKHQMTVLKMYKACGL